MRSPSSRWFITIKENFFTKKQNNENKKRLTSIDTCSLFDDGDSTNVMNGNQERITLSLDHYSCDFKINQINVICRIDVIAFK